MKGENHMLQKDGIGKNMGHGKKTNLRNYTIRLNGEHISGTGIQLLEKLQREAWFVRVQTKTIHDYIDWLIKSIKRTKGLTINIEGSSLVEKADLLIEQLIKKKILEKG